MDIIITILFLCLAIFSAVVYFRSQGNSVIKFIKGIFAFSIIFRAIDVYKNEDQIAAFIMVAVVFCLSYRRFLLNKAATPPLSVIKTKIDNNDNAFNHEETKVISSKKKLTSSEKMSLKIYRLDIPIQATTLLIERLTLKMLTQTTLLVSVTHAGS